MWSIGMGSLWGGPLLLAATSSHPPHRALIGLQFRVRELNRLAGEGTFDEVFEQRAQEAMDYLKQLEEIHSLPVGTARPDSLLPLLRHAGSVQDGLRRLNQIVDDLKRTISSLPVVSPVAPDIGEMEEIQDRPSWIGRFQLNIAGASEALQSKIEKPAESDRLQNLKLNSLAARLWNQQWLDSQKEAVKPGAPVERGVLVPCNEVRVSSYSQALALTGMAAESALAILDDGWHRHLLAHVSSSMPQERLNTLIHGAFASLAMKRIYVLPGSGLAKESAVRILAALQAVGVSRLESTVKLLLAPHHEQFPTLLLYEGEIYSKPAHFVSR